MTVGPWIPHVEGGVCPVGLEELVIVKFSDGTIETPMQAIRAGYWADPEIDGVENDNWRVSGDNPAAIVAYAVVKYD